MCLSAMVETGVLFIRGGCGVPQNGTPWDTVHLHRRPPPASTGYCSSTVDLLQPPPATVHPRAHVHPASTAPPPATVQPTLSTGSCSTTPPRATIHPALHRLLFNQPSTGSYSSSPPLATFQLALHGVLFIQPSTGSCSSTPNRLNRSGSCSSSSNTTGSCSSKHPQQCSLFTQR